MVADARVAAWSRLHHGLDPTTVPFVAGWLRLVWWLARPLRGLRPTVITVAGVVTAVGALSFAGPAPWLAFLLVVVAALCDALDGAVAVLTASATRSGAVADAVADRVCDVLFALVLWRCGAPLWMAVAAAVLAVGVDGMRRGLGLPTVVTVAERPTFAVCASLACLCAALSGGPGSNTAWPVVVCAGVWLGLCGVGIATLLVRRDVPSTSSSRGDV